MENENEDENENRNKILKFAACDLKTILVFELIDNNNIGNHILKKIEEEDLRTLCNLNLYFNYSIINLFASGGKNLKIFKIYYERNELKLKPLKRLINNSNINKIIFLNEREKIYENNTFLKGKIVVCDQCRDIGIYNISYSIDNNIDNINSLFLFKVQCFSYINCILYLPDENILVSGSDRDRKLHFWRIKKSELELIKYFDIYSTISNNSLLDINGNLLVGQINGIRVFHHESGIITNNYFYNNEEFGDEFGGVFSIKSLGRNYFICGRAFGFCSIFLLREKNINKIIKINIFRNNNASVKPYDLINDNYIITDICVKENSEEGGLILVSSADKTLKVYSYQFHQYILQSIINA